MLKRDNQQHCSGLWSFPGGKIENGEQSLQAAKRELKEETGLCGAQWQQLGESCFSYPDRSLHFILFACLCNHPESLQAESAHTWVSPERLDHYPMPEANDDLIQLACLAQHPSP